MKSVPVLKNKTSVKMKVIAEIYHRKWRKLLATCNQSESSGEFGIIYRGEQIAEVFTRTLVLVINDVFHQVLVGKSLRLF